MDEGQLEIIEVDKELAFTRTRRQPFHREVFPIFLIQGVQSPRFLPLLLDRGCHPIPWEGARHFEFMAEYTRPSEYEEALSAISSLITRRTRADGTNKGDRFDLLRDYLKVGRSEFFVSGDCSISQIVLTFVDRPCRFLSWKVAFRSWMSSMLLVPKGRYWFLYLVGCPRSFGGNTRNCVHIFVSVTLMLRCV